MNFSSTLQILKIEDKKGVRPNPSTGKVAEWKVLRGCLLDDSGEVVTVGSMRIPRDLEETARKGTFRAGFALTVPDWGDDKGDIVAVLTSLVPMDAQMTAKPAPEARKAA